MIETYKILRGIYDTAVAHVLPIYQESVTRGNSCRLVKNFSRCNVRKYSFTQKIVNIWNSLPEHVVNSSSVNTVAARGYLPPGANVCVAALPPPSGVSRNLKRYISGVHFQKFSNFSIFFHSKYQYNFSHPN